MIKEFIMKTRIMLICSMYLVLLISEFCYAESDFIVVNDVGRKTIDTFWNAYKSGDCETLKEVIQFKDDVQKAEILKFCDKNKILMILMKYGPSTYIILPKCLADNEGNIHARVLFCTSSAYQPLSLKLNTKMDKVILREDSWLFWDGPIDPRWPSSEVMLEEFEKRKADIELLSGENLNNYLTEQVIDMKLLKAAKDFLDSKNKELDVGYNEALVDEYLNNTKIMSKYEHKDLEISKINKIINNLTEKINRSKENSRRRKEDSTKQEDK
jgi:hypothetical protein